MIRPEHFTKCVDAARVVAWETVSVADVTLEENFQNSRVCQQLGALLRCLCYLKKGRAVMDKSCAQRTQADEFLAKMILEWPRRTGQRQVATATPNRTSADFGKLSSFANLKYSNSLAVYWPHYSGFIMQNFVRSTRSSRCWWVQKTLAMATNLEMSR